MDPISSIERNIGIMARNNQALSSMLSQLAAGVVCAHNNNRPVDAYV